MARPGVRIVRLGGRMTPGHERVGRLGTILAGQHDVEPLRLHPMCAQWQLRSPMVAAIVHVVIEKFAHAPWPMAGHNGPRSTRARNPATSVAAEDHSVMRVPSSCRNCAIQAGCAGHAGAVTRLPSVTAASMATSA